LHQKNISVQNATKHSIQNGGKRQYLFIVTINVFLDVHTAEEKAFATFQEKGMIDDVCILLYCNISQHFSRNYF